MSNILCHLCGGLVDRIGLQPTGVRLCGCVAKFKARKARISLMEAESQRKFMLAYEEAAHSSFLSHEEVVAASNALWDTLQTNPNT